MDTPRYKTIISVLNSSNEGFDEYIEMSKRISLFVETDGASEANGKTFTKLVNNTFVVLSL